MAKTYEPIATTTLGSAATTVTFSSIPSTYTDLVIVGNLLNTSTTVRNVYVQFNGDTTSSYSKTVLYGNGSSAVSARDTSSPAIYSLSITAGSTTETASTIINIMNYANTTTYKTAIGRYNVASNSVAATVGMWRKTDAITSVTLTIDTALNLAAGSTFTLYGIKAA